MSYLEKKYGRNIVSRKWVPDEKSDKIVMKLKTLYLLLIIVLVLGIVIGSVVSNIVIKSPQVQCGNTLKGGD